MSFNHECTKIIAIFHISWNKYVYILMCRHFNLHSRYLTPKNGMLYQEYFKKYTIEICRQNMPKLERKRGVSVHSNESAFK